MFITLKLKNWAESKIETFFLINGMSGFESEKNHFERIRIDTKYINKLVKGKNNKTSKRALYGLLKGYGFHNESIDAFLRSNGWKFPHRFLFFHHNGFPLEELKRIIINVDDGDKSDVAVFSEIINNRKI